MCHKLWWFSTFTRYTKIKLAEVVAVPRKLTFDGTFQLQKDKSRTNMDLLTPEGILM